MQNYGNKFISPKKIGGKSERGERPGGDTANTDMLSVGLSAGDGGATYGAQRVGCVLTTG